MDHRLTNVSVGIPKHVIIMKHSCRTCISRIKVLLIILLAITLYLINLTSNIWNNLSSILYYHVTTFHDNDMFCHQNTNPLTNTVFK